MTEDQARRRGWEELRHWGRERHLGELDALMWRTERHPAGSWTGVVILMLDRAPAWERLRAAHEWFTQLVPRFRERVVDPAVPVGRPAWAPDPGFDLSYHLRRVQLPAPGSKRQLLDLAQAVALTPLDRSRPPWVGTLIEGLEEGRAAYLMQAHHVLMDGMALTQLFSRVLSPQPETTTGKPEDGRDEMRDTSPIGVARDEVVGQLRATPRLAGSMLRRMRQAALDPSGTARYGASLARVLVPPPTTSSATLQSGPRRTWRFGSFECPLDELKAAGKSAGGTVNDTFVCILLGGLRRYCATRGEDLVDVPISMPVAMRKADEAMGGNRFAGAFFKVPSSIDDPAERIREMRRHVEAVRGEPALDFLGHLSPAFNRTPSEVASRLLGKINSRAVLTTSSWPGVVDELYIAGARFEQMYVFAPLPGTVMTGAMCTHLGTCCIGVNVDGEVIEEPEALWEGIREEMAAVLALGST